MFVLTASFAFGILVLSSTTGMTRKSIYGLGWIFNTISLPLLLFNGYKWIKSLGRNPAGNLSRSLNLLEQFDQCKLDDKTREQHQKLLTRAKWLDSRLKLLSDAKLATFFWNLDVRNLEREIGVSFGASASSPFAYSLC